VAGQRVEADLVEAVSAASAVDGRFPAAGQPRVRAPFGRSLHLQVPRHRQQL
jgi:hypothetical protein